MADNDSMNTNGNSSIPNMPNEKPRYADFIADMSLEIETAKALLAGAQSVFLEKNATWEEREGLNQTILLLEMLNEKLDSVALSLNDSTYDYEIEITS